MVKGGLEGTVWENLTFFLSGCNDYGHNSGLRMTFCKDVLADKLLQYEKKVPEAFLIGRDFMNYRILLCYRTNAKLKYRVCRKEIRFRF